MSYPINLDTTRAFFNCDDEDCILQLEGERTLPDGKPHFILSIKNTEEGTLDIILGMDVTKELHRCLGEMVEHYTEKTDT